MTHNLSTQTEMGARKLQDETHCARPQRTKHTPRSCTAEHCHGVGGKRTKITGEITKI